MSRELLQQALDALVYHRDQTRPIDRTEAAITALREALAAPQPEPVAWLKTMYSGNRPMLEVDHSKPPKADSIPVYAAPPAARAPVVPLTDDMVEAEFVSRGDDKGQGLHPYWKDAFREGFNFARSQLSAAPAAPVPLTDDQIDEIWDGSFDSADPKRQLSFRQIITRAIEAHHGIGGGK